MLHAYGDGKVGIAPGTTTITYQNDHVSLVGLGQDDSGVLVKSASGVQTPPLYGATALGLITPTDFDISRQRGYLPVQSGWISGRLGQTALAPEEAEAVKHITAAQAEAAKAKREDEHFRALRSGRVWAAVAGIVGIGGLIVSVYALQRRG